MKFAIFLVLCTVFRDNIAEDVRLDNLEPSEAQQYIDNKDTSLKYAPKVDSNVPAVRYLGNDPHNVLEDIYLANQYHGQDGLGGYLYGYAVPDIAKTERKQAGGDLRGAYNYVAGNGQEIKVEYWDDGTGFHQVDNVPKTLPEDLPEVKAAKEEFARIWQEQAERNSRPVESPYNSAGEYAAGPLSKQGQLERKQQFAGQQNYQQQSQYQPQPSNNYQQKAAQPGYQQAPSSGGFQQQAQNQYNPNVYQQKRGFEQQGGQFGQQQQAGQYSPPSGNAYQAQQPQISQQSSSSGFHSQGSQTGGQFQQPQTSGNSFPSQGSQIGHPQQTGQYSPSSVNTLQPQQPQIAQQSSSSGFQSQGGHTGQQQPFAPQGSNSFQQLGGQATGQVNANKQFSAASANSQQSTSQWNQQSSNSGQYGAAKPFDSHQKGAGGFQQTGYQKTESDNYSGQYSENRDTYSQSNDGNDGKDEENNGPPRGFFYNFDYPVGIIVQKQGRANVGQGEHSAQKREGNVKDIYASNKELFEKQLAQGRSGNGGSSSSYLHI